MHFISFTPRFCYITVCLSVVLYRLRVITFMRVERLHNLHKSLKTKSNEKGTSFINSKNNLGPMIDP